MRVREGDGAFFDALGGPGDFALVGAVDRENAALVDEPFFGVGQPSALLVLLEFFEELPVETSAQANLLFPDLNQFG